MCHHLLCSALTGGADSVSGSGPALLCPGMSEWAFFRSFWRCFDCPAYVQTAHVCSRTCWALRLTAMFWPLLNLKNQVCFPLPILHICLSDFMNWFMLPSKFAVMDNIWCHWLTESDLQVCVSKNLTCCTKKMEEKYQLAARRDIQNLLQTSSSGIKLIISRDVAAFQGKQPPLEHSKECLLHRVEAFTCVTAVFESRLVFGEKHGDHADVSSCWFTGLLSSQTYDLSHDHSDFAAVCTDKA